MSNWRRLQKRSIADRKGSFKGVTPESWHCVDCGADTAPGCPGRVQMEEDFRRNGRSALMVSAQSEVYTVHDHVWRKAGMEAYGGCLCVGCLEERIGRPLTPDDFPDHVFNTTLPGTTRLLERQGRHDPLGDWESAA
jgi:hypothetical protein